MNVCMVAYAHYDSDNRIMRYADTLAARAHRVDVVALRRPGGARRYTTATGVHVDALCERRRDEARPSDYALRISVFLLRAALLLARRQRVTPYDVVHAHSVPDAIVFAAIVPKLLGAKVILDIHDVLPELYASKFGLRHDAMLVRLLKLEEKLSARFADHVIVANDLWRTRVAERSASPASCSAILNYPDPAIFRPDLPRTRRRDGRFVIVYPGTLNRHQGVDIAIDAVARARASVPGLELHVYGEGGTERELRRQITALGLDGVVVLERPVTLHEIASVMRDADLGVVPKRHDGFGGEAFSTKIPEFMAVGTPVVVADTPIDTWYFDDSMVRFFKAGDAADLAGAIVDAYRDRDRSAALASRALAWVAEHSWTTKRAQYLALVEALGGAG